MTPVTDGYCCRAHWADLYWVILDQNATSATPGKPRGTATRVFNSDLDPGSHTCVVCGSEFVYWYQTIVEVGS